MMLFLVILESTYFPVGVVAAQVASDAAVQKEKDATMSAIVNSLSPAPDRPAVTNLPGKPNALPLVSALILPRHRVLSASFGTQSQAGTSALLAHSAAVQRLPKRNFRSDEDISVLIANAQNQSFQVTVKNPDGVKADVVIGQEKQDDNVVYTVSPRTTHFKPGRYTVIVQDEDGKSTRQDFTWGVLAINVTKSVYLPHETADLAIAVLNDSGDMVCNAKVDLEVTGPNNASVKLSTDNGSISVNLTACKSHSVTLKPDYETHVKTEGVGHYTLNLTAKTSSGTYSITDGFDVKDSVPFDVERVSATRIYPANTYPVVLHVTAHQDFTGTMSEVVPDNFSISKDKDVTGYDLIQKAGAADKGHAVLGASVPGIGMPFSGSFPVTLGFGEHLLDPLERDLYAKFDLSGHDGIDFGTPVGTPILAVADGNVDFAGTNGPYGTTIIIQHDWGKSYYGHLSVMEVKLGQRVNRGDEIGLSGATGIVTGPHLHFGIRPEKYDSRNGYFGKVDPAIYLGMKANPAAVLGDATTAVSLATPPPPDPITSDGMQILTWKIAVKKGETIDLGYDYQAPPVSPQFYLLGPATFVSRDGTRVFQESRQWQIASDVMDGKTVWYFHKEDSDFKAASGSATLTTPEADTQTNNTASTNDKIYGTDSGTGYPCQDPGVTNSLTEVRAYSETTGEKCVQSFYSSPVGQSVTIDKGDSMLATVSAIVSTTGSHIYPYVHVARYNSSTGGYQEIAKLTTGGGDIQTTMFSMTASGSATTAVTLGASDRLVFIITGNVQTSNSGGGTRYFAIDFDRATTAPSGIVIYKTVITPGKPGLSGTDDDDFNPATGSAAGCTIDTKILNDTKWYCGTGTGNYSLGNNGLGNASGSAQWLRLENVNGNNTFTSGTYIYQPVDTNASGSGTITTAVNHSTALTAGNASGLLLWASNTDYLIVQASQSATARFVSTNNSGTVANPNTLSATYNTVWLRWTKSNTTYTASYSTDGSTFTTIGTFTHAATFTRAGLSAMSGSGAANYSAAFEYFSYSVGTAAYSQGTYRWYQNTDAVQPTTALRNILENETTTLTDSSALRLRLNQTISSANLLASFQAYSLQYTTATGGAWATAADPWCNATSPVTCNTSWTKRKKITFNNSAISSTLSNFPVLVSLSTSNFTFANARSDGFDVVFTSSSGDTLNFEREKYDGSSTGIFWVNVPSLPNNNTTYVWMYYGNSGASSDPVTATVKNNTWNSNYNGVWHLGETSGNAIDSTSNGSNGTIQGTVTQGASGEFGTAYSFNGSNGNYVQVTNPVNGHLDFGSNSFSYSAWVNMGSAPSGTYIWFYKGGNSNAVAGYAMQINNTPAFYGDISDGTTETTTTNSTLSPSTWYYATTVVDRVAKLMHIYINGVEVGTGVVISTIGSVTNANNLCFGGNNGFNVINGSMQEAHILNTPLSADWIKAEYNNQSSPSTFDTFGAEEAQTYVKDAWCNTTSPVTCNTGWTRRKKIVFNNAAISSTLSNFPVLVSLTTSNFTFANARSDGFDIAFTGSDGTALNYEREKYDGNSTGIFWVNVPSLPNNNTTYIWMYYGNSGASSDPVTTTVKNNTWNSNYIATYHLSETSGNQNDSTTNGLNFTTVTVQTQGSATGQIDGADQFTSTGNNNTVHTAGDNSLFKPTNISLEAWVYLTAYDSTGNVIARKEHTVSPWQSYALIVSSSHKAEFHWVNNSSTETTVAGNTTINLNTWYHLVGVYDGTHQKIYVNGTDDSSSTVTPTGTLFNSNSYASLTATSGTNDMDGTIDEVRYNSATGGLSADWIKADYNNTSSPSVFDAFSSEETQSSGLWRLYANPTTTDGMQITTNLLSTSTSGDKESYNESSTTVVNPAAILSGETAEWDFALDPAQATAGTTYYFRMVLSDGTSSVFTYTVYPAITTQPGNDQLMRHGKFFSTNGVKMPFTF